MNLAEAPADLLPASVVHEAVAVEPVTRRLMSARMSPMAQRAGMKASSPPAFLSFDAFCRKVDALIPPLELHFNGQEDPFLHPRFLDMVAYAAQRGFEATATTRMPALSTRRAEECVQSGLRRLVVELGPDPSGLARRSLVRLEEAKQRLGSAFPEIVFAAAK